MIADRGRRGGGPLQRGRDRFARRPHARALQGYFGDSARFTLSPRSVCGPSLRQVTDLLTPPPPGSGPKDGSVTCFATACTR